MKKVISLLTMCAICISSYAWDVSVTVQAKSNKKWQVTTSSAENCKSGKGMCFVLTGKVEFATHISYQEGADQITLSVEEGSDFFDGMDDSRVLQIGEDSPILTELNSALGLPNNSRISAGTYVPERRNGRFNYSLKLK